MLLLLEDNDSLGRNESRMAKLVPSKDFCKQHIILHYISVLLGAGTNKNFKSFPIGKVGDDETGRDCIERMKAVGMDISGISIEKFPTLFSVCYQYPDGSGGNITTAESASSKLSVEDIDRFISGFSLDANKEIILAVPEVPLETRMSLLQYGRKRGSFNVVSLLSSEVKEFERKNGFLLADLLSVNIDEASHIAGVENDSLDSHAIIDSCIKKVTASNPEVIILITNGAEGNYTYLKSHLHFTPALKVAIQSTAGAGDSFLAGTITGLCCGLPLINNGKQNQKCFSELPINSAVELGTLLASLSVTSKDTIHLEADADYLQRFARENNIVFSAEFSKIFTGS
jgi:sugar/nucleoside kinase (ribokinase family)